ncbi:MAG TPA: cation transporter [Candidatus Limnocylindrales bacterium]|jgi:divalent metal cation (Fe/Co/Zn/Cd) transporter|nr:cation transporter [Candidatus Limnocylindrales bacterium]
MERERLVQRALQLSVLSIGLSGLVGGVAVVVGLASGTLVLLGFGIDAAIDAVSSAALVWRFRIEAREPERAERVEALAETIVGLVLLVLGVYLGVNAVQALAEGAATEGTLLGTILLLVSLVTLPPLAVAKYRVARRLASGALRADSILTGMAALLALISLASLVLGELAGLTWADAVGALIVTVVLLREGWSSVDLGSKLAARLGR